MSLESTRALRSAGVANAVEARAAAAQAKRDLSDAALYYAKQGGPQIGQSMVAAAIDSLKPLQRMPGLGSPTIGERCALPGLRSWGVRGWPLRWFCFERDGYLDVLRLLGERQDIAVILAHDVRSPD